jgi:uncharacterized MAPEG superfamily protein
MTTELSSLVLVSTFTALLWAPYVTDRMLVAGIDATVGYPAEAAPLSPWAKRLRAAHANAVENLVVFAALVLAAQALDVHTALTALAATLFLWSRIAHATLYALGVKWLRTVAFVGGFAAQMMLAYQLLAGQA